MIRRVGYRTALTALVFALCWIALGFLFLLTPLPGALGIASELFQGWFLIALLALATGGALLTLAAINGIFPPVVSPPARRTAAAAHGAASTAKPWGPTTARVPRSRER